MHGSIRHDRCGYSKGGWGKRCDLWSRTARSIGHLTWRYTEQLRQEPGKYRTKDIKPQRRFRFVPSVIFLAIVMPRRTRGHVPTLRPKRRHKIVEHAVSVSHFTQELPRPHSSKRSDWLARKPSIPPPRTSIQDLGPEVVELWDEPVARVEPTRGYATDVSLLRQQGTCLV